MRKPTLAQQTWISPWSHGESNFAECTIPDCEWQVGAGTDREILYAARRHVVETGHNPVTVERTIFREVGHR